MGKIRSRSRKDGNHDSLVRLLESLGCSFQSTAAIPGALDGIVGCAGIDIRVEFKDPEQPDCKTKLTTAEQITFDQWCGHRPIILRTQEDAISMVYSLRKQAMHNSRQ